MSFEIPNYTLLQKLGEGCMAEVWLGEHQMNARRAAIKILKPAALTDDSALKLFVREGQVLASFDHPNIVRIYDNARFGNLSYLVMECLTGGTLLERMQAKDQPVTVAEALGLTAQIAMALEAAHQRRVIHRDLKPANIMLRNETTPVLTDFGIARLLDRSISVYAQANMIVGTAAYMSPEQVTGQNLDGRSDLYALGVLFFELLTGQRPFIGTTFEDLGRQHLQAPIPILPASLSVLQPIVNRLLAKAPDDRYAGAQQLVDALKNCFLNEATLRQQVSFTGTSKAWSSQLRALGFVVDSELSAEIAARPEAAGLDSARRKVPDELARKVNALLSASEASVKAADAKPVGSTARSGAAPGAVAKPQSSNATRWSKQRLWLLGAALLAVPAAWLLFRYFSPSPGSSSGNATQIAQAEVSRGLSERFVAADGGTMTDTTTGLIWSIQDNGADIDWAGARQLCAAKGEGWALPTSEELVGLYVAEAPEVPCGRFTCRIPPLLQLTNTWFWSNLANGKKEAWYVNLGLGMQNSDSVTHTSGKRALCVRRSE